MTVTSMGGADDLLSMWVAANGRNRSTQPAHATPAPSEGGLRFAFYGRMSTEDFQDPATSRRWQRTASEDLLAGRGVIVAEYFDLGYSRRRPWRGRPQAAALLAALTDPRRPFDAIVVGEYERAFSAADCSTSHRCSNSTRCGSGCPRPTGR